MDEIIKEFLIECNELIDQMDRDLVDLEKSPANKELLSQVFRAIHTIKGTSGTLGFPRLEQLTHSGENLLSLLREGKMQLNAEIATALLSCSDLIRQMLRKIEESGREGEVDISRTVTVLDNLVDIRHADGVSCAVEQSRDETAAAEGAYGAARSPADGAAERGGSETASAVAAAGAGAENDAASGASSEGGGGKAPQVSTSTIRVDVHLLDKLMDLVGELVLVRNQTMQLTARIGDADFQRSAQRLKILTSELQEGITKTRMQPIETIWKKLPRLVRDVANSCHKRVRVEMEGSETELDKTILEAINDPLLHILRNAIDHGIELPAVRQATGKPEEGRIFLRAYHEGGQVNIEISDDGQGISVERVKQKALQSGAVTAAQVVRLSDQDALNLVFLPGISTAKQVTNISGRGVGMDIVRTNIENIGGSVDLRSEPGRGTTLTVKIPLTLAIIPALIVATGGERFAIPQVSLLELVRLEDEAARRSIERVHGFPVFRLRGNLLPLVELNRELELGSLSSDGSLSIVVLQTDGRQFGLVVDQIYDTEEIVVKPLGAQIKGIHCFSGATILGDGHVALILDVWGLAKKAGFRTADELDRQLHASTREKSAETANAETWLLFRVGERGRMALPLSTVSRLEKLEVTKVEQSGEREVVQYRGQIMPLLRISDYLGREYTPAQEGVLQVIVYPHAGGNFGLIVDEILDIVQGHSLLEEKHVQRGIAGCAVIQDRVTDLFDVRALVESAGYAAVPVQEMHA
jgi:two-component system chemotaxis sensor kinase CheA